MMRAVRRCLWFTSVAALAFQEAVAQRVIGAFEDATVVPRGSIRVSAGFSFAEAKERFATGHPGGAARGQREPLGASFSFDSLGPNQLEIVREVVQPLRSLSGQSTLALSVGALSVAMRRDVRTVPFSVEGGLTSRITVGVLVPFVFVRNDVAVLPGANGNIGLNPALSIPAARTRNGTVISQIFAASARLRALLAACETDPSGSGCGTVNANRQAALAFLTQTDAAAADIVTVYGDPATGGARFVPIVGSSLESAIFARLGAFNTVFQSFLGLPVDSLLITARPVGATRLSVGDLNTVLSDSAFGVIAQPLGSAEHGHVGDIEVGAKFLLYDSFNASTSRRLARGTGLKVRLAAGAAYRFATGMTMAPNAFTDVGTGDGAADIEARGYLDLVFGDRFWQSAVVRVGMPQSYTTTVRIPDSGAFSFPAAYREQLVTREPGSYFEAEWSPRLVLNDFFAVAGNYRYRRAEADNYAGTFNVTDLSGAPLTLDAATLGAFSEIEEQRAAIALSYSTVGAYAARRSAAPLELTLALARVLGGAGIPATTEVNLTLRVYHKVFGANNLRR